MSDVTPTEYFTRIIQQQFAAAIEGAPEEVAGQPALTAIYEIVGEGGGVFGLRASDRRIDVLPGDLPEADIRTTLTLEDWRSSAANGMDDPVVDYVRRRKVDVVKSLRGTVRLELEHSDGSTWQSATVFGGAAEPEVTLRMTADDYVAMMRGELNGQMAFLSGKLKFEGSLPLLMQVGALSA